jgi:hypothetical protein
MVELQDTCNDSHDTDNCNTPSCATFNFCVQTNFTVKVYKKSLYQLQYSSSSLIHWGYKSDDSEWH